MAGSGVLFVLFLISHLTINLTSLISREAYESAWKAASAHTALGALMPLLVMGFLIHIICGLIITARQARRNTDATMEYETDDEKKNRRQALLRMLVLGIIIVGLLVLHLSHFRAKILLQGISPYDISKTLFYNGFYVAMYAIWIIALHFHVSRGFFMMLQAGPAGSHRLLSGIRVGGKVLSTIITLGFILIPVYFYLGFGHI